jgi:peptide chain release factor 1
MKAILEIRAGEGGDDSKLFVRDMLRMYLKYFESKKIKAHPIYDAKSEIILEICGEIENILKFEGGVHRVQRVPPTETRGRRHSSTLTVAVLPVSNGDLSFDPGEVEITAFKAGGKGGQHRNKVETAIRAVHKPTGITATCADERSKHRNEQSALKVLAARVLGRQREQERQVVQDKRVSQIGKSGRAEKIRTYNFIENRVKDVRVKKAIYCLDKVMNGNLDKIHDLIRK